MVGGEREEVGRWTSAWRAGSRRLATGVPFGGEVVLVGVAVLLMSGGVAVLANTAGDASPVTVAFNAFMDIGLAGAAVVGAVVLRRSFEDDRLRWQVAAWYLGGILFLHVLYTWANLAELLAGTTAVWELADGYVLFGNLGGLLGLVAGFNRGRAAQNRQLVTELERRNDTLEFVNHMLRHDVLNGTQTIQGYATLLDESLELEGESEAYLEKIREGSDRITELTENVRVLMDTVGGEAHRTEIELSELVAEEVAHARERHPDATFETDIQPGVTAVANSTFRAVVGNLLDNAVEHNDTAEPTVSVAVSAAGGSARVRVADDGPGFPEGMDGTAFQPGVTEPTDRGMGVGLYLVQVLVGAVDGSVSIGENEPRGAVVTVELQLPAEFQPR